MAERLSGTRRSLVHRDLQSQNVMIRNGEPFLIDFQGMRFGSLFYDLGSLLCDPYVDFSDRERQELLSFYYGLSQSDLDWVSSRTLSGRPRRSASCRPSGPMDFWALRKALRPFSTISLPDSIIFNLQPHRRHPSPDSANSPSHAGAQFGRIV